MKIAICIFWAFREKFEVRLVKNPDAIARLIDRLLSWQLSSFFFLVIAAMAVIVVAR